MVKKYKIVRDGWQIMFGGRERGGCVVLKLTAIFSGQTPREWGRGWAE